VYGVISVNNRKKTRYVVFSFLEHTFKEKYKFSVLDFSTAVLSVSYCLGHVKYEKGPYFPCWLNFHKYLKLHNHPKQACIIAVSSLYLVYCHFFLLWLWSHLCI
jgi:hypothetical protein